MEPSGPDLADAGSSGPFWAGWCQPAKRANAARRRRGRAVPSGLAGPAVVATQHRSPLSRALRGPAAERLISAASRVSHLPPLYLSRLSVSRLSVSRLSVSRLNVSRLNVSRLSVSRPSAPGALHRASPRPWPTAPQMRRRARAHAHTHRRTSRGLRPPADPPLCRLCTFPSRSAACRRLSILPICRLSTLPSPPTASRARKCRRRGARKGAVGVL